MKRPKVNRVLARAVTCAQLAAGNIDGARCLLAQFIMDLSVSVRSVETQNATLHAIDKVLESAQKNADDAARLAASQNVRGVR